MRPVIAFLACMAVTVVAGGAAFAAPAGDALAGHWEGALLQRGQALPIRLDFAREGAVLRGRFSVDRWRVMDYPLDAVKANGARVTFSLGDDGFTARLSASRMTGSFSGGDGTGTFELRRAKPAALPYDAIPVRFHNGGIVLSGTLAMPRTRGRHACEASRAYRTARCRHCGTVPESHRTGAPRVWPGAVRTFRFRRRLRTSPSFAMRSAVP